MENNNESYELLAMSSDSVSDVPKVVISPRKKLIKRRVRGVSSRAAAPPVPEYHCRGRAVWLYIATILMLGWFIMLTWVALVLNSEIRRLDTNVQGAVAGGQGVSEALQKCHSQSRDLQQNQTALFNRLSALTLQLANFSAQVAGVGDRLGKVEERLAASPELVNVPHELQGLSASVATFGSQIQDLVSTVAALKESNTHLSDVSHTLEVNITALKGKMSQLETQTAVPAAVGQSEAEKHELSSRIEHLSANLSSVNDTLVRKLQWAVDDQLKDHKAIEGLQEMSQNVSARVTTLQNECSAKTTQLTALSVSVDKLSTQVNDSATHYDTLTSQVSQLSAQCQHMATNCSQQVQAVAALIQTQQLGTGVATSPTPAIPSVGNTKSSK